MSDTERIQVGETPDDGEPFELPVVDVLTGRAFITGKSGSGKSNTASVVMEELLDAGFPTLVVDTDGEYYGLKEEYELLHVGADEECDVQIEPEHAERMATLALEENVPIILDVSGYLDEGKADDLIRETARHLFAKEKKLKKPFLLVIEECHEYIPEGGGMDETGKMLIKIGKRGRKHGLGIVGISQRPADVKKDFITQANWLVWHRLTWENDTKVVSRIVGNEYGERVADLPNGRAYVQADWTDDDINEVQFREKRTFDAGATPGLDDFERPELKSVSDDLVGDLQDISEQQQREEERIANLERELQEREARIEELEDELESARDVSEAARQMAAALTGDTDIDRSALEERVMKKDREINELKADLKNVEGERDRLERRVETLEAEGADVDVDDLADYEDRIAELEGELDDKRERIAELENELDRRETELATAESAVREREAEIERLQDRVAELRERDAPVPASSYDDDGTRQGSATDADGEDDASEAGTPEPDAIETDPLDTDPATDDAAVAAATDTTDEQAPPEPAPSDADDGATADGGTADPASADATPDLPTESTATADPEPATAPREAADELTVDVSAMDATVNVTADEADGDGTDETSTSGDDDGADATQSPGAGDLDLPTDGAPSDALGDRQGPVPAGQVSGFDFHDDAQDDEATATDATTAGENTASDAADASGRPAGDSSGSDGRTSGSDEDLTPDALPDDDAELIDYGVEFDDDDPANDDADQASVDAAVQDATDEGVEFVDELDRGTDASPVDDAASLVDLVLTDPVAERILMAYREAQCNERHTWQVVSALATKAPLTVRDIEPTTDATVPAIQSLLTELRRLSLVTRSDDGTYTLDRQQIESLVENPRTVDGFADGDDFARRID